MTEGMVDEKIDFGLSCYEIAYTMALGEIEQYVVERRQRLADKKRIQKESDPEDIASQINLGAKMKAFQQVIDKIRSLD